MILSILRPSPKRRDEPYSSSASSLPLTVTAVALLLSLAFTDDPEQVDSWFQELGGAEFEIDPGR